MAATEYPELDEERLAAWRGLLNAHVAVIGRIERELAEGGHIPLTWYDVLVALSETPDGRLRLGELAARIVLSRSGLTRLVDRLAATGLIQREACQTDKRGAYAVLTDEGRLALRQTWPVYARGIGDHFARHLSAEQAQLLATSLEAISDAARAPPDLSLPDRPMSPVRG